jgi:hypothetical protein
MSGREFWTVAVGPEKMAILGLALSAADMEEGGMASRATASAEREIRRPKAE